MMYLGQHDINLIMDYNDGGGCGDGGGGINEDLLT